MESEVRRCMSEHTPFEMDYQVVWPDDSVHWIAARGVFQYDSQDKPQRMLGIIMDITERKRADEALRESVIVNMNEPKSWPSCSMPCRLRLSSSMTPTLST